LTAKGASAVLYGQRQREAPDRPQKKLLVHDWSPVEQQTGMPEVADERSYVFLTHHKTGTNLMKALCNLTARLVTGERTQCAYCLRLIPPMGANDRPSCIPNTVLAHGPMRGTFSRFTLVSSVNEKEFSWLQTWGKDFRAVHMIRDPVKMAISSYAYDTFLATPAAAKIRWDASVPNLANKSLAEKLKTEATAIAPPIVEEKAVHDLAKSDSRVLTLDLEAFSSDFNGAAARLFRHFFDDPPADQLSRLMKNASAYDVSLWNQKQLDRQLEVHAARNFNATEALEAWEQLRKAGDPVVQFISQQAEPLGYGANYTRRATFSR